MQRFLASLDARSLELASRGWGPLSIPERQKRSAFLAIFYTVFLLGIAAMVGTLGDNPGLASIFVILWLGTLAFFVGLVLSPRLAIKSAFVGAPILIFVALVVAWLVERS